MTWYQLTNAQIEQRYGWYDLPQADQDALVNYVQSVVDEIPLVVETLGGIWTNDIAGVILGGSMAYGTADHFSDYDVFVFLREGRGLFEQEYPGIVNNALSHLLTVRARDYNVGRRINFMVTSSMFFRETKAPEKCFGINLLTGDTYDTLEDVKNAFNVL